MVWFIGGWRLKKEAFVKGFIRQVKIILHPFLLASLYSRLIQKNYTSQEWWITEKWVTFLKNVCIHVGSNLTKLQSVLLDYPKTFSTKIGFLKSISEICTSTNLIYSTKCPRLKACAKTDSLKVLNIIKKTKTGTFRVTTYNHLLMFTTKKI